jgi:hypothetical protein
MVMSSSMRRRSGLMGFSLIGGSRPEGGVFDPSILKTERPHRHLRSINMVSPLNSGTANNPATLSRGSGFVLWWSRDVARWR